MYTQHLTTSESLFSIATPKLKNLKIAYTSLLSTISMHTMIFTVAYRDMAVVRDSVILITLRCLLHWTRRAFLPTDNVDYPPTETLVVRIKYCHGFVDVCENLCLNISQGTMISVSNIHPQTDY